jgi:predicted transcriptional regulator
MSTENPPEMDKVFKALGHMTRRRILQLLAESPKYPYELAKILDLNRRVVLKHLEALEDAGLVQRESAEGSLGPDRVYYKVNVSFGLSTTVLPNTFSIRVARVGELGVVPTVPEFAVPGAGTRFKVAGNLLAELEKVDRHIEDLDRDRMSLVSLRGQLINQIEAMMRESDRNQDDLERVRALLDPVSSDMWEDESDGLELWSKAVKEILSVFESMMEDNNKPHNRAVLEDDEDTE